MLQKTTPTDNIFTTEAIDTRIKEFLSNPSRKAQVNPIKLKKRDNKCKLDERISVGRCIPYLNYLKEKDCQLCKFHNIVYIMELYDKTMKYFKKASQKCDSLLDEQNCYKIMVK